MGPSRRRRGTFLSIRRCPVSASRRPRSAAAWTIPADRIGNEKPIEIVSERWYSPELMLVVATRQADPRSGETSHRPVNLKRGEPDAALFKLPGEYELRGPKKRP